jgi:hypothetical protein
MVFNLTNLGLNPATANITLGWLSDNNVAGGLNSHIRLCKVTSIFDPVCAAGEVPNSGNSGESSNALTVVNITSGFTSGLMALDFIVYNAVVPTGLILPVSALISFQLLLTTGWYPSRQRLF